MPRWALAADVLAFAFFIVGTYAMASGGWVFYLGDVRFSAHSAARPYAWMLAILLVRYYFVRQPPAFIRDALRGLRPLRFEEAELFPEPIGFARRLRELAILTLGFSVLVAIATWPQVAHPYAVSDMGDPLFSIWRLMWITHEFPRNPLNLFNANQMYPELRTLTFSDPVLAPSLLFAPLHALGVHRIVAYNIVLLLGSVFSGVAMFMFVRALTGRQDAAWISGAIFAIYPYRIEHHAHLELQMTMWMPVALWFLHRTLARGRLRDGLVTGFAVAAQFYSSLYYGAFLVTYVFVVAGALWIVRGAPWPPLRSLAAGGLLAAVLFAPVASVYLKTRSQLGDRDIGEVTYYSAVAPDYLKSHYRSLPYRSLSDGAEPERSLFPRITPVVLALIAFWPPLSVARITYLLALAFSLEMSLGMNGSIFPWLYSYLPLYAGLRVPARYSIFLGMTLAILAGYGVARCFTRWPQARTAILTIALTAVVLEALPRIRLVEPPTEPPPIYGPLVGEPPSVLAEFPTPDDGIYEFSEFVYLYFSTFHWQTLMNGQSGRFPASYNEFVAKSRSFPSDEAVNYLRGRGVKYVSIHGAFYPQNRVPRLIEGLDARTDLELLTSAKWRGSESRLYRLK